MSPRKKMLIGGSGVLLVFFIFIFAINQTDSELRSEVQKMVSSPIITTPKGEAAYQEAEAFRSEAFREKEKYSRFVNLEKLYSHDEYTPAPKVKGFSGLPAGVFISDKEYCRYLDGLPVPQAREKHNRALVFIKNYIEHPTDQLGIMLALAMARQHLEGLKRLLPPAEWAKERSHWSWFGEIDVADVFEKAWATEIKFIDFLIHNIKENPSEAMNLASINKDGKVSTLTAVANFFLSPLFSVNRTFNAYYDQHLWASQKLRACLPENTCRESEFISKRPNFFSYAVNPVGKKFLQIVRHNPRPAVLAQKSVSKIKSLL